MKSLGVILFLDNTENIVSETHLHFDLIIKAISHHLHDSGVVDDKFHAFSHTGIYGENIY